MSDAGDYEPTGFGAAVRKRRVLRQWTVYRLAQKAGMSAPYLAEIETGAKGKRVSVTMAAKLAQALGITTDRLLIEAGLMDERSDGDQPPLDVYLRERCLLRDDDIAALTHIVRRLGEPPERALRVAEEPAPYDPDEPSRTDNLAAADEDTEQFRQAQGWIDEEAP